jgi:chromosome segregation ATPase
MTTVLYADYQSNTQEDRMTDTTLDLEGDPMIEQAKAFFGRMLDVIANATQLARDVQELRAEVSELREEVEEVHQRNMALDNQIQAIRQERDQFAADLANARSELQRVDAERADYHAKWEGLSRDYANLDDTHNKAVVDHYESMNAKSAEIATVTAERDSLREELADTQRRFWELEREVRRIAASITVPVTEEEPPKQALNW